MTKIRLWVAGCLSLIATGCATNYDVGVKIERSSTDFKILIGEFDGAVALIHGNPKNAEIRVSDGTFRCAGISTTGEFSTNMISQNKVKHLFHFSCDDGTTGQVPVLINVYAGGSVRGIGVGILSNGTKIKVIVGDMAGQLSW